VQSSTAALFAEQLHRGESAHLLGTELEHRFEPWPNGTLPARHAVVDVIGKVRLRVICVGNLNGRSGSVGGAQAIADESAVGLEGTGKGDGIDVVAGQLVAADAVIVHGHGGPVIGVGGIAELDVSARIHQLVIEGYGRDAIGIGDLAVMVTGWEPAGCWGE
jgi:hypothetical protein